MYRGVGAKEERAVYTAGPPQVLLSVGTKSGQASKACAAELVEIGSNVYSYLPIVKKLSFFFLDQ